MSKDHFPKIEAGRLAIAAAGVLNAQAEELGPKMAALRIALKTYDDAIMALAKNAQ